MESHPQNGWVEIIDGVAVSKETYLKEAAFGSITGLFHDYEVVYSLDDVTIIGWPERYIQSDTGEYDEPLRTVLKDAKDIVRDLENFLKITFSDVYAVNIFEEGWEQWSMQVLDVPKLGSGSHSKCNYPILKIENSLWVNSMPEYERELVDELHHWRLIGTVNCIDICARSASGGWEK